MHFRSYTDKDFPVSFSPTSESCDKVTLVQRFSKLWGAATVQ
jgi:hypothetical protein